MPLDKLRLCQCDDSNGSARGPRCFGKIYVEEQRSDAHNGGGKDVERDSPAWVRQAGLIKRWLVDRGPYGEERAILGVLGRMQIWPCSHTRAMLAREEWKHQEDALKWQTFV